MTLIPIRVKIASDTRTHYTTLDELGIDTSPAVEIAVAGNTRAPGGRCTPSTPTIPVLTPTRCAPPRASVVLAATLVSWFASGLVKRRLADSRDLSS